MRRARIVTTAFLLFAPFFMARPLTAQSVYGMVWGRLTAVAGTPVSGALVTVIAAQTEARNQAWTDVSGYFTISNLTPDLYQVDVQADGFKRVQGTVAVSADSTATVNSTLQAGDPNVVAASTTASASVLKLDRTDVSTQFDLRSVEDLPLLDLNVTRLQLLVPGAAAGKLFIPSSENPQNGTPVNVNGQHFSGSAFQLDGTESRDPLEGIVVINPPLDSVGEMKITTQGYNAEFGQSTAGVVTIQTRTGSNAWHGDGFGFRRSGFGQTQNPFDPPGIPSIKYSIFGGSIGGPIARNKLFIFGDYQGTRSSQGVNLLLSVPPDSVRNTCVGNVKGAPDLCNLSAYSPFMSGQLVDPYHKDAASNPLPFLCPQKSGPPAPCNEIPNASTTVSSVTSQAVALLNLLPRSNHIPAASDTNCAVGGEAVCDNYLASGQDVFNANQFDVRTDYNASSRLRLFGRYSFGEFYENGTPAFGAAGGLGTSLSGFGGVARTRNQGISSGFTYTIGPKLLTDFRFGYFRYRLNVNAQDYGQTPDIKIPGIFPTDPRIHDPFATGLPDFEIPGQQTATTGLFSGGTADYLRLGYSDTANSCSCPLREREQQFQFVNNWTRQSGKHIVKWGADLRYLQNYRFDSNRPTTGYFDFSPGATGASGNTGLGLATFLLGDVTSFNRTFSSPAAANAGEHQKRAGFYGQDTWRINSRLTLNYGLRWEIYFPQTVTGAGGFLIPNLNNHDPATTYFSNGLPVSNTAGGVSGNLTNFAPRVGIAYLVNPTTVIRAGYGRSFDAGYAGDIFGIAGTANPPVTVNQDVEAGFNLAQGPPVFNFPSGPKFSQLQLATANDGDANPPVTPPSGAVLYALPSRVRVPTVDSWNLTFQHELTPHLYFELAYVGDKGTDVFPDNKLGTYYDLNQPSLQNFIVPVAYTPTGKPIAGGCKGGKGGLFGTAPTQFCLSTAATRSFFTQVKGFPNFDPSTFTVDYFGNNANDNYNSLQAKVNRSFNHGYSFMAHYTWSKGLDYEDNFFAVNPRVGYGPDNFDIRHRFVMTNIWNLPLGRGKAWLGGIGPAADRFLGGWTISAITVWRSGIPFSPTYTAVNCGRDTDSGDPCRPNLVGTVHISGSRAQYFTTTGGQPLPAGGDCSANGKFCGVDAKTGQPVKGTQIGPWQRPGAGLIGTAARDSLYGPGFFQSDIGLGKVIPVTEGVALRFRADAFNAFNKVNLGQPNGCVDCANGGVISSLAFGSVPRTLQFSLRIEF
jgi:Carboxypeptidase regulatory-like domain/TonB dependent receptor